MRVFRTDRHRPHAPAHFIARGRSAPCPERPQRAGILDRAVRAAGHALIEAGEHGIEPVARVHDAGYLEFLRTAWSEWEQLPDHAAEIVPNVHPGRNMAAPPNAIVAKAGHYQADTACPIGPRSWEGALASSDVAVTAADAVQADFAAGQATPFAYALCRPPGHHAYADQAGGFCLINNTAVAAQRLLDAGHERVAILDVDVHHGNGTQGIFYERADVLTVSLHGDPAAYYPFFAGFAEERGRGAGEGFNINHPLPRGLGDDDYLRTLDTALGQIAEFGPSALVVALGLDASEHDPLAFLAVTTKGFRRIGGAIADAGLPTLLVQEGGYISDFLGTNLVSTLRGFEERR